MLSLSISRQNLHTKTTNNGDDNDKTLSDTMTLSKNAGRPKVKTQDSHINKENKMSRQEIHPHLMGLEHSQRSVTPKRLVKHLAWNQPNGSVTSAAWKPYKLRRLTPSTLKRTKANKSQHVVLAFFFNSINAISRRITSRRWQNILLVHPCSSVPLPTQVASSNARTAATAWC